MKPMTTLPSAPAAAQQASQAEDPLLLAEIEAQLIDLARASAQRWQKIAVLMLDCEANQLWAGAANSYTAWVRQVAERAGVHESNLWRALKAGKFYNTVREQAEAAEQARLAEQAQLDAAERELQAGRRQPIAMLPDMPALGDLDSKASPESLDLIEKISRAAPPPKVAELVQRTLAGATTRQELRQTWRDYRPAVEGTARGRAPKGQAKRPPTAAAGSRQAVVAADILQALRADGGQFLSAVDGRASSKLWSVHTEVAVRPGTTRHARRIDAVCAEMATAEQPRPGFHAVEIKVSRADLAGDQKLTEYADFVDTLWLAGPAELAAQALALLPQWVGVLAFEEVDAAGERPAASALRVARPAGAMPRKADLRSEVAFELLKRLL